MEHHDEFSEQAYQVRLERFEGPLDLLLHLIKKSEIDIYGIPIALITSQYLDYLSVMKSLNLSVAGEFLVMAATLIHIKSRMLLAQDETDQNDDDGPDPREELVRRLLEYKQFKEAGFQLDHRERTWRDMFVREPLPVDPTRSSEVLLESITLFDLVDALQGVVARIPRQEFGEVIPDNLTVRARMQVILETLEHKESITFVGLFDGQETRQAVIVTFLALLELIRIKVVRVFQGEMFGAILVTRTFSAIPSGELAGQMEPIDLS